MTTEIAIAASARDWPDRLQRHVLDHGGAKVLGRLMGPSQVVETGFDVLFIDDVCSFLTPRLVTLIRESGRQVVGVFAADDGPDAKRRLLECGISDVIESDAPPLEFLHRALTAVETSVEPTSPRPSPRTEGRVIGVLGVTDGVGATEVSVTLALIAAGHIDVTLIDLDPSWPSVAQRLDLAPHPNVRTVVDLVLHHSDEVDRATQRCGPLSVVGGVTQSPRIPHHELAMSIQALAATAGLLIADLGSVGSAMPHLFSELDGLILVGVADPIGISRLLTAKSTLSDLVDDAQLLVVVNKTPQRRYYQGELRRELAGGIGSAATILLPFDDQLMSSVWDGTARLKGPFAREIARMARLVGGVTE